MERPLIIEGPDGAGKSTLARGLSATFDLPVYHSGGPPANRMMFEKKLQDAEDRFDLNVIDRTPHISEPIYAKASSRNTFIPEHELHARLSKFSPIVIYCRLDQISTMFRSIDQSRKPHKSPEHLAEVLTRYKSIVEDYDRVMSLLTSKGFTVIKYSWERLPVHKLVERLKCAD